MRIRNKIAILLLAAIIVLTSESYCNQNQITLVEAHSGRTDSSGGHHDYKNKSGLGDYHYHHGMGPHLHPNGVCPYSAAASTPQAETPVQSDTQSQPKPTTPPKPKVKVSNPPTDIKVGDVCGLKITLENTESSYINVTSSNSSVVKVNSDKSLTAVGEGSATIEIKSGEATTSFTVNVTPVEVEEIQINPKEVEVQLDKETNITPIVLPENATNKTLIYTSEDNDIATVDQGAVKAHSVGKTNIKISANNGISTNVTVKVFEVFPEEIETKVDNMKLELDDTYNLNVTILPENANNKNYTITSSNEEIVKIEAPNKITPLKDGSTTVTIKTDNDIIKEIPVEVFHIPVSKIDILDDKIDYLISNTISDQSNIDLSVMIKPDNATFDYIEWTSSDRNIIDVTDNHFMIKGTGNVTLTVNTYDNVSSTITFHVVDISHILLAAIIIIAVIIGIIVMITKRIWKTKKQ